MTEPLTAVAILWLGILLGGILAYALFHHDTPPPRND